MTQTVKTPKYSLEDEVFLAKCVKCYDADTIHIVIKINNQFTRFVGRLQKIDTPEIRSKETEEKIAAKTARDYLRSRILDDLIVVRCGEFDKYGRLLIEVYSPSPTGKQLGGALDGALDGVNDSTSKCPSHNSYCWENSINKKLVDLGHAYIYEGGKKQKFSNWSEHKN